MNLQTRIGADGGVVDRDGDREIELPHPELAVSPDAGDSLTLTVCPPRVPWTLTTPIWLTPLDEGTSPRAPPPLSPPLAPRLSLPRAATQEEASPQQRLSHRTDVG